MVGVDHGLRGAQPHAEAGRLEQLQAFNGLGPTAGAAVGVVVLRPAAVQADLNDQVVVRDFSQTRFPFRTAFASPARRALRRLVNAPCVFQRYVEKAYDVRAVVIGERIFACRIDSQASRKAEVDWRVYDNAKVAWQQMRLRPKNRRLRMIWQGPRQRGMRAE